MCVANKLREFLRQSKVQKACHMSTTSSVTRFQPSFDPHLYTQGYWLDRDKERRQARKLSFNFDALLDHAVRFSPGALRVIGCEKKEGGFNRVFRIQLDNGKSIIARLPTSLAGLTGLTISSEVATLQYVKDNTKVPVPNVFSWSCDPHNEIGAEYIIMEEVPGVQLKDVWNTMTASQHIHCIKSIGYLAKALCTLTFPTYGSLYFRKSSPQGSVPLDETYCIGPICAPHHWDICSSNNNVTKGSGSRGPWQNLQDYLASFVFSAKSRTAGEDKESIKARSRILGIIEETSNMLTQLEIVSNAAGPTLFHPDFHTRNIFVDPEDPTVITGIIDWQSAAIEPAFVFASNTPDFAEELPYDEVLDAGSETDKEVLSPRGKIRLDTEFCAKIWAAMLQICPKYREASALDPTLVRFLAAGSAGWLNDRVAARSLLYNLGDKWEEIGLPGQSLYRPGEQEIDELKQELDKEQSILQLQERLSRLLRCDLDGWVAANRWEETLPVYLELYDLFIASSLQETETDEEKTKAIAEANALWPFDHRR